MSLSNIEIESDYNKNSFIQHILDKNIVDNKYYAYHNGEMILCADTQTEIFENSKVCEILKKDEIVMMGFVGKSGIITMYLNKTCIVESEPQSAL